MKTSSEDTCLQSDTCLGILQNFYKIYSVNLLLKLLWLTGAVSRM